MTSQSILIDLYPNPNSSTATFGSPYQKRIQLSSESRLDFCWIFDVYMDAASWTFLYLWKAPVGITKVQLSLTALTFLFSGQFLQTIELFSEPGYATSCW
jgi:hypothetical protein